MKNPQRIMEPWLKNDMPNLLLLRILVFCIGGFCLMGCTMYSPVVRDVAPIAMPDRFSMYTESDPGPGKWWQAFGSPELDTLVNEALSDNFDIRTAVAKVKQAEATARKAGADLYPLLGYSGGAQKTWQQTKTSGSSSSNTQSEELSLGLSASYELDLWGKVHALKKSELQEYQATREDLEAAAVTVAADVTSAWIDILSVRQQITILEKQIETNRRILELQEQRFLNGKAYILDVSLQNEALAEARAILPTLRLKYEQQCNALNVLLGRAGNGYNLTSQKELPELIPLPETGLPSDLLASRPDVRSAGLRLNEADWQVSAAKADRLPSIALSAETVFASGTPELLFSNWISNLAASITGPLFDGGYRSAEVDLQKAKAEEYLTAYAQTVAVAIQEVEDCLIIEKRQNEYIKRLNEELKASQTTVKDAQFQYMNGQDNYLSYLSAWINVQSLERQLVAEQATLIKNRVSLYRTLGGDWTKDLPPSVALTD